MLGVLLERAGHTRLSVLSLGQAGLHQILFYTNQIYFFVPHQDFLYFRRVILCFVPCLYDRAFFLPTCGSCAECCLMADAVVMEIFCPVKFVILKSDVPFFREI